MTDITAEIPTSEQVLAKAIEEVVNTVNRSTPSIVDSSPFIVGAGVSDITQLPSLPNGTLDTPVIDITNTCEELPKTEKPEVEESEESEEESVKSEEDEEEEDYGETNRCYVQNNTTLIIPREITVLMIAVIVLNFMNFVFVTSGVSECLSKMP